MPRRRTNAFILAILFSGLGHIYYGKVKKGIGILVAAILLAIWAIFINSPDMVYFGYAVTWGYWGLQLYDLYRIANEEKARFQEGWETK